VGENEIAVVALREKEPVTGGKIIVGFDNSADAKAAAGWALDTAERTGASVEFFYAYQWPDWLPATATIGAPAVYPDGEIDRAVHGMLNEVRASARETHPAVPTDASIVNASAALTLIGRSAEAGLIVLGSRGHSGVIGLLGSVSLAVSENATCPVVVVRGVPQHDGPVVVGVDDSAPAQAALRFAAEQARIRKVALRVIRAWLPGNGIGDPTPEASLMVTADEQHAFDSLIASARADHPDVEITGETVVEHPAAALVRESATAGLLVVGTRGRSPVRGMLLGSVSQHMLRHSAASVAIVHGT
jgi:nucleotide-binding universal stress UspA family protein